MGRFLGLARKELRETLRDRRTIITLVLMPLLVYPLLSLLCQKFLLTTALPGQAVVVRIGVETEENGSMLSDMLQQANRIKKLQDKAEAGKTKAGKSTAGKPAEVTPGGKKQPVVELLQAAEPDFQIFIGDNIQQKVADRDVDLGVEVQPHDAEGKTPRHLEFRLHLREGSPAGRQAQEYITSRLELLNKQHFAALLQRAGVSSQPPLVVKSSLTATDDAAPVVSLAALAPLVLVLMTITGAVYPAIDCTAGERERGTLESLVASPAPRFLILLAKYVAVLTVALLTAGVNLLAMGVTTYAAGLGPVLFGDTFSPLALVAVFGLMILFAAFFSGLLLAVTSFARSFKEAQAYLIPLMLLSLGPGLLSLTPGVELTPLLAATPLLNMVLLARDVLQGTADPGLCVFTILVTLFYAVASLALAARIFGSDSVLYGSSGSWANSLRRPAMVSAEASPSSALFGLALLFPVNFLLASLLAQLSDVSISVKLILGGVITAVVFAGFPLVATLWSRVRWDSGLRLRLPPLLSLGGAVLLGVSMWPLAHEIVILTNYLGIVSLDAEKIAGVLKGVERWSQIPLPLILLAMGVTPAVCEELFFRGYLFAPIRRQTSPWKTIAITALLFGAFHVVTSTLTVERFLPSTALGLLLGYVCYRTGSIWPGVVTHACHNCLLLTLTYYRKPLASSGWGPGEGLHLPVLWIVAGVAGTAVAVVLIMLTARPAPPTTQHAGADHNSAQ